MPEARPETSTDSISIGDVYYLLFRHKWKIIIFSLLGVVASLAVLFLTPSVFESEASLLVRYVSDTTLLDRVSNSERITRVGGGGESAINSEIAILTSRNLVEKVMDEMGVNRFSLDSTNTLDRSRIAERIMSAIGIAAPKDSNVIRVTFKAPTPIVAQEFLRRLTESYLLKHIEIHRTAGAYEFLSQQTDQLRSRLAETEEELRKVKYTAGVVSIEESKQSIALRAEELTRGLGDLEASLAAAKARVDVIHPFLSTEGTGRTSVAWVASIPTDTARSLESNLQRQRQRELELLSVYTADSIPLKSLREQIKETEALLAKEAPLAVTNSMAAGASAPDYRSTLMEAQASLAELHARIAVQKDLLARTLDEARKMDAIEAKIVQLQRNKELQEANYKYFCQSLEHARVDEALNSGKISNISVIQPATLPSKRLRVKLPRNMAIALLLGVMGGLGLAVLQEYFVDQTLRKPKDILSVLQVPLLMSVPLAQGTPGLGRPGQGMPLLLNAPGEAGNKSGDRGESVWQPGLSDYYEVLRDRLLAALGPVPSTPCILGITSCARGAGVSTVAAGLALAFARGGEHRVVLVNGGSDSSVPQIFGVNPVTGLTEMKADTAGNTTVTQHNHYVVPAGDVAPPAPLAGYAPRFAALLQHLRDSKVGVVIVDLPPVSETSLTLRVGHLLDGVLLVIPAEKVNRHVADRVKELLAQSDAKLIGTVLNMQRQYVPDWIYPMC
jgi:uncharacterized protein involved in exopolysaccharide biosynthesis/Mrp family chromosome partitioning ATPase